MVLCTDSKLLYDRLVQLGTTQEKGLMIDAMCLRQTYEKRLISEVKWIGGEINPADAMAKSKACPTLAQLIDTNRVKLRTEGWVERMSTGVTGGIEVTGVIGFKLLRPRPSLVRQQS